MSLISLASGYGNFPVPAIATDRVAKLLATPTWPSSPTEGLPELRQALAARYHRQGASAVEAAHIVVTPGTKAALFGLLAQVLRPGDEVLLPTPNWFGFREMVVRAGATLRELPLRADDNYALRPEAVQAALTPRTRLLLFTNPVNPSGRIYSRAEVEAVLAVTRKHQGLFVLADEIYDGICFGPESVPTLLSFDDPHGQHLVVNGFSKSLGLIGWSIGYLVAPPAVAAACTARQFATLGSAAMPSQLAALGATENTEQVRQELCQQLASNRHHMLDFLQTLRPNTLPFLPAGTYYAFPDLRAFWQPDLPPAEASAKLVGRLLAAGVAVVDGASCGAPGFVRLSYAVSPPDLFKALSRLETVLGKA